MFPRFGFRQDSLEAMREDCVKVVAAAQQFMERAEVPKMGHLNVPVTLIDTRDCFAFDLLAKEEVVDMGPDRRKVIKKTYYFDPECVPDNFGPY